MVELLFLAYPFHPSKDYILNNCQLKVKFKGTTEFKQHWIFSYVVCNSDLLNTMKS